MTVGRDHLSKSESVRIAAIEAGVPLLVEAREIIGVFQAMICKKIVADLEPSLARASSSLIASFASGVVKDREAVIAGHLVTLVQGPDRRADHQAQARQTPNVPRGKDRSPPGPPLGAPQRGATKCASEPNLDAE
jgi:hypothetical protein